MENLVKALAPQFPTDIRLIRAKLASMPVLDRLSLSDKEVEFLWETYSGDLCASYLCVHEDTLNGFAEWLRQ